MRLKKSYPSKAELEFIGKLNEEESYFTQCKLQDYAKELYDNSIHLMKKNGDHAYWHVINREIDLMLQNDSCDFEMVEAMLECYMQHAFEIRCYEYVAYAHMFLMKTKLIRQLVYAHEEEKNTQIKEHIENFRRYYHKHNPFRKNLYAEIRLKLFEAIFNYQSSSLSSYSFKQNLDLIEKTCISKSYKRELHIIKWIKTKEYSLSPAEIKFLYQSYPIIIQ